MPAVAVIGGMAVNIRLAATADTHRATQDIDVVADDGTPTAIEILSHGYKTVREHTVVVNGIDVDIIETHALTNEDLDGLDDDARLFVAGHRWALETATAVTLTTTDTATPTVQVPVATSAGLVATKSHAAGYPRAARRASKHGGDLYDIFRLIEAFDARGELRVQLAAAPGELGRLVARVVQAEILTNPASAMRTMQPSASTPLSVETILDVTEAFVAALT